MRPLAISLSDLWDQISDAPASLQIAGALAVALAAAIAVYVVVRLWRRSARAGGGAAGAFAAGAVAAVIVAAIIADRPGDVSNPDAEFVPTESRQTVRLVDWPLYGFDEQRSRFLPARRVKPPFVKKWEFNARKLMEYSPVVADGTIYGINNNGTAFALDAATGRLRWRQDVAELNASSPTYHRGRLYLSNLKPGQVLALDARTGRTIWRHEMPGRTESSPVVAGGKVIMGCECGSLFALDRRDGRVIWEADLGGEVKAAPALEGGIAYIGAYGGTVAAIRAADGSVKWRSSAQSAGLGGAGNFYATPTVAFGRVYIGNTDGRMYSFEKRTGELAWSKSTANYVYAAAVAANTPMTPPTIYFGSYDGTFYALDARTGDVRWERSAGGAVSGAASVVGSTVYVANLPKTRTVGFNIKTGNRVFTFHDGAYNPVISDGRLLYLTGVQRVYALRPTDKPERRPDVFGRTIVERKRN